MASTEATIFDGARQQFLSLFPRRDAFIWKPYGQERWQKAKGPLLDHQILGVISDNGRGLYRGCYWSHKTRHAVLDIDAGSKYHNAGELGELTRKLAAVGLNTKPYQSSDSGGWHLYVFLDDWAESEEVAQTIKSFLRRSGYDLSTGQLEVFPSGAALRLPLQPGFAWLGVTGNVVRAKSELNETEAIASFLFDFHENQKNWAAAKTCIESQIRGDVAGVDELVTEHRKAIDTDGFDQLWKSSQILERIEEARYYFDNGLTSDGQRHSAVIAIEHLLWYGDRARGVPKLAGSRNDIRRQEFLRTWLEKNHNGRCSHIKRGDWHTVDEQIRRACQWRRADQEAVAAEYEPYMLTERSSDALMGLTKRTGHLWLPSDLERANQKREDLAREKIRDAVNLLTSQERRVTGRQLMRLTGCSYHTVKRHEDIWKASPVVALSRAAGDLEPGGVGGFQANTGVNEISQRQNALRPGREAQPPSQENFLSLLTREDSRQTEIVLDLVSEDAPVLTGKVWVFLFGEWREFVDCPLGTPIDCQGSAIVSNSELDKRFALAGNCQNEGPREHRAIWQFPFILPYGANRGVTVEARDRAGADLLAGSWPIQPLAFSEVLAAAQGGIEQCRRHNYPDRSDNGNSVGFTLFFSQRQWEFFETFRINRQVMRLLAAMPDGVFRTHQRIRKTRGPPA